MNLTVSTISKSLADYLAPILPGVAMYEDPNQQGSQPPCMFLQVRYGRLTKEMSGFWVRRLGLDLVYLLDYNLPGAEPVLLRTYDREWNIDLNELHYKFELRERVNTPEQFAKMQTMDLDEDIYNGKSR